MTPERLQRIGRIVEDALDREGEARAAFLEQACAGDNQLRREVESRIVSHEQAGSFVQTGQRLGNSEDHRVESTLPAGRAGDVSAATSANLLIFNGRYVTEGELGRGGMGQVYVARDTKLGRRVAIKVLIPGSHGEDALRRFEQEARASGSLNHPNVLTIYDVGIHQGEPYIVSELLVRTR